MATDSNSQTTSVFARPWAQLIIGIICMVMIANLQYGWTLFVGPIGDKYHWTKASIQFTFFLFVLFEDVAGARGRVPGRSLRSEVDRGDRRCAVRHRLDDEFIRRFSGDVLFRSGDRWHRRRRRVRHLHRQCGALVPREARAGGGPDRGRLRHGLRADHHSHRPHDQELRLRAYLPDVRAVSGHCRGGGGLVYSGPGGEFHGSAPRSSPAARAATRRSRSRCSRPRSSG